MLQKQKTLLENKNKPKKRIFNPYLNDEEYKSVDENQSIKEKSKNPFWVPTKNAEVFEVRDIMRQEKEIKRLITRKQPFRGGKEIDSFEKQSETFNNKYEQNSLYITEQKFPEVRNRNKNLTINIQEDNNSESDYLETVINNLEKANTIGTKILEKIKEKKEKEKIDDAEKNQSEKLEEKIDMMANRRKDSVRDYIKKTREIILTKYTTEIKKERAIRLTETYQNEIESIKDSIFSMKRAKNLFEDQFFFKFERYVKYLQFQKEKEKNELNNLLDDRNKFEIEVVKLDNKIIKQKEKLIQYSEYRDFLICIKERRIKLPLFFLKMTESINLLIMQKDYSKFNLNTDKSQNNDIQNSNRKNSNFNTFINYNKNISSNLNMYNNSNNNSNNNLTYQPDKAEVERYNSYLTKNIFESADELNDDIKKMEMYNINLLEELNQKRSTVNEMNIEFERSREEEGKNNQYICKDIIIREKYFSELKDINVKLIDEKNSLLNEKTFSHTRTYNMNSANSSAGFIKSFLNRNRTTSNMSFTKQKYNQNMIYSKINHIYQCCMELKINKQTNMHNDYINILWMLKTIEKSLDFLKNKQKYYFSEPEKKVEWDKKKFELDKERKIKKTKEAKINEEIKREQLKKNISERTNRILVIPKRKVPERVRPDGINSNNYKDMQNNNDQNFDDLFFG